MMSMKYCTADGKSLTVPGLVSGDSVLSPKLFT